MPWNCHHIDTHIENTPPQFRPREMNLILLHSVSYNHYNFLHPLWNYNSWCPIIRSLINQPLSKASPFFFDHLWVIGVYPIPTQLVLEHQSSFKLILWVNNAWSIPGTNTSLKSLKTVVLILIQIILSYHLNSGSRLTIIWTIFWSSFVPTWTFSSSPTKTLVIYF